MSLHQDIREQMKEAMKARETARLDVLRGLLAAFTNELKSKKGPDEPARTTDAVPRQNDFVGLESGGELSDEEILTVISRAVKQRKDSIEQFEKGGRADLAETEKAELKILETYLPAQMSREEVFAYVKEKQVELNMSKDKAGQFMGIVMKELKGRVDGMMVKEAIDALWA